MSDNIATTETTVNREVDLSVDKSGPAQIAAGSEIYYNLTVENNGPSDASGVTLTDILPAEVSFISATPGQGNCSESGGTVTCGLGILAAGSQTAITVIGRVDPGMTVGSITNTVTVSGSEPDTNPSNNSDTVITSVYLSADLAVTKSDSPDPVLRGENLTYGITVYNYGPSNATGVILTDVLPAGVHFVTATPNQGTCDESNGTVTCNLGNLVSGDNISISIVVNVDDTTLGMITNTASVTGNESDPNTSNNSVTQQTTVQMRIFLPVIFKNW